MRVHGHKKKKKTATRHFLFRLLSRVTGMNNVLAAPARKRIHHARAPLIVLAAVVSHAYFFSSAHINARTHRRFRA
jgi:hypothetical protein